MCFHENIKIWEANRKRKKPKCIAHNNNNCNDWSVSRRHLLNCARALPHTHTHSALYIDQDAIFVRHFAIWCFVAVATLFSFFFLLVLFCLCLDFKLPSSVRSFVHPFGAHDGRTVVHILFRSLVRSLMYTLF